MQAVIMELEDKQMENRHIYKIWRDKLLAEVSETICRPCSDERKIHHSLDYENPLNCGCNCDRIEIVLRNVRQIDTQIKKCSQELSEAEGNKP